MNLIPIEYYIPIFYNAMFLIVLFLFFKLINKGTVLLNPKNKDYRSLFLLLSVTLYIGLRPLDAVFVDMGTYNSIFNGYASGRIEILLDYDILWQLFMKTCSGIMTAKGFFLLCAIIYILPLYIACKKWLGNDRYILFLMFIASFSFWSYGVNGIRNGIATSIFVLAVSSTKKKYLKYGLMVMSYFMHASLIIPIAGFVLSLCYKKSKHYFLGWLLCIPLSIVFGSVFEIFFESLFFADERLSYLTVDNLNKNDFAYTGFRWDFLIYSAFATFAGYYFIVKRNFKNPIYIQLFNIYLTANAFWILVIRANFSNRFAYLSWFLMAVIIFYPFFKKRFFKAQKKVLIYTVLGYYGFTYLMFLLK